MNFMKKSRKCFDKPFIVENTSKKPCIKKMQSRKVEKRTKHELINKANTHNH